MVDEGEEESVFSGAQEIFKLLPHTSVERSRLPGIFGMAKDAAQPTRTSTRVFQVYGCVVTCKDMVEHKDPKKSFDKADYYVHAEHYNPVFHEKNSSLCICNCELYVLGEKISSIIEYQAVSRFNKERM
ncbi:putative oxidoreductase [Rosa chinensis]|uniref:Putative oxidoreductase n=1 Tax=Rosa chinensis TaxID=74649 RepID=A0A2P6RSH6_ROSCH|nr:putative oxidoreductase [Rosa chinensis]